MELASQGEDVVITVEGKAKARLTRADGVRDLAATGPATTSELGTMGDVSSFCTKGPSACFQVQLIDSVISRS